MGYRVLPTGIAAAAIVFATAGGSPASAAHLKPEISGLLDRQGVPPTGYTPPIDAYVVTVNWSDLQSTNGGAIVQPNAIKTAISYVDMHPGFHIKIRIMAGAYSPTWALNIGGTPVTLTDPTCMAVDGTGSCPIPRFWTTNYKNAYVQFEQKMGALYDAKSEIQDVTVSRCMTTSDEPLLRQVSLMNDEAFRAANYTDTLDEQCQSQSISETAAAWPTTHVSFSFNPYQDITSTTDTTNEAYTESLMDTGRSLIGQQFVIENNSIRCTTTPCSASQNPMYESMYNHMIVDGAPFAFQTATCDNKVGSLANTLSFYSGGTGGGSTHGPAGSAIELPFGYSDNTKACFMSAAALTPYDTTLESNPQ
jgi:hypothetical protein